jgi:transcriptional regulator with XRE-family HTH domain
MANGEQKFNKTLLIFRKNIYYLRKKVRKITLDELAEESGVSRDALYKIENNRILYPSLKTVLLLAEYFEISLGEFLGTDLEMAKAEMEDLGVRDTQDKEDIPEKGVEIPFGEAYGDIVEEEDGG